jgi:hypothetical protein
MDLNPVEIQGLKKENDIRIILQDNKENNYSYINYNQNNCFYKDQSVNGLFSEIREKTLADIIHNLRRYIIEGDENKVYYYLCKIKHIRFGQNIKLEESAEIVLLIDEYIRRFYCESELIPICLAIMIDLISMKGLQIQLDWKVYFKIFVMSYTIPKFEFSKQYRYSKESSCLPEFIKRAYKFFTFTKEDYTFLRTEVVNRFSTVDGHLAIGLLIGYLFLPSVYLAEDQDLQERLMNVIENRSSSIHYVLLLVSNFINHGLKVKREDFIDKVFTFAELLLTDGLSITSFTWPEAIEKDKDSKLSVCYMMAMFLVHKDFVEYRETIDRQFNIIVNLLNTYLTENTASHSADYTFSFIRLLIKYLKTLVCHKTEKQVTEYDSVHSYTILEEYKPRVMEIISWIEPILTKCLLYSHKASYLVFLEYITFIDFTSISEKKMSILTYLYETELNFDHFIRKFTFFINPLFENIENKDIYHFLLDVIHSAIDKISSLNSKQNADILDFFSLIYLRCHLKKAVVQPHTNLEKMINYINDLSVELVKKVLQLYSFFAANGDYIKFTLFYTHLTQFLNPETIDTINKLILGHISNNIFKENFDYLHLNYFVSSILHKDECKINFIQSIWEICFNNLVEISETKTKFKSFNKVNYELGNYVEAHLTKEHYKHFESLIETICYYAYKFEINEKFEEQFFTLVKLYLNGNKCRRKIVYLLLYIFPFSLVHTYSDKNQICLPDIKKLNMLTKIYNLVIKPYENSLTEKFNELNTKKITQLSSDNAEELEELLVIFLRISRGFFLKFQNLFLNENIYDNFPDLIDKYHFENKQTYQEIISIRNSLIKTTLNFFKPSKKLNLLKKSEKYFRLNFASSYLEVDKSCFPDNISFLRKIIYYYREIKIEDLSFITNKYMSEITRKSHVRFPLYCYEKKMNEDILTILMKTFIKHGDKTIDNNSQFNFIFIFNTCFPDGDATLNTVERFFNLIERKMQKIPIMNQPLVSDYEIFKRLIAVLNALIDVCYSKQSDYAYLVRIIFKFRVLISKFKFDVSNQLYNLRKKIDYIIKYLKKPTDLFKIKENLFLEDYLLAKTEVNAANEANESNRTELIRLLTEYSEFNFMNSHNYYDNLYLLSDYFKLVSFVLTRGSQEEIDLLNKIEQRTFEHFMAEKDSSFKLVYIYGLLMIYKLRYRYCREYEAEDNYEKDNLNYKKNYMFNKRKGFKKNYLQCSIPYLEEVVKCEDKLFNFIHELYKLQEIENYYIVYNKSCDPEVSKVLDSTYYALFPEEKTETFTYEKKYQTVNISPNNLFSVSLNKLLFFICYFTGFNNYDSIFLVHEKLKKIEESDGAVCMNILVAFLTGLFKKDKMNGNLMNIQANIQRLMQMYSYNCYKRIDSELLTIFCNVLRMCTPNQSKTILFDSTKGHLMIFDYDYIVSMSLYYSIWERFGNQAKHILSEADNKIASNIKPNLLNDQIQWLKNSKYFESFYLAYIYNSFISRKETDDFVITYDQRLLNYFEEVYAYYKSNPTKEALKILNILMNETVGFIVTIPGLLVKGMDLLNDQIELDSKSYKSNFYYFAKLIYANLCFKKIPVTDVINQIINKMSFLDHPEKINFFSYVMRSIYLPRLNILNQSSYFHFNQIIETLNNIKFKDCVENFCDNILRYLIISTNDNNLYREVEILFNNVEDSYKKGDNKAINSIIYMLSMMLKNYEIFLKKYTEKVILELNDINARVLKNKGNESKLIKKSISLFYNRYSYTYSFVKKQLSEKCVYAIENLSKAHSYYT